LFKNAEVKYMKTLYFIGNEELWNDAWFKALVESLEKKQNLSLMVYDSVKDSQKIVNINKKITVADRIILKKGTKVDLGLDKKHESLCYIFSKEKDDLKKNSFIEWGLSSENFLEKIGISETSQVIEDDFLSEVNIASEVSRVIESEQSSTLDSDALSSSTEDLSKLLEADFSSSSKDSLSKEPESELGGVLEGLSDYNKEKEADLKLEKSRSIDVPLEEISLDLEKELNDSKEEVAVSSQSESSGLDSQDLLAALENAPSSENDLSVEEKKEEKIELNVLEALDVQPENLKGVDGLASENLNKDVAEEKVIDQNIKPEIEVGKLLSSMSGEVSGEDLDVIKRYSNIKERELRESQASAEALRRQIRYFDERLKKSEEERRKLILKVEELQSELRTTSDKKDENRAQLKNIESHYEEKIKELQIQLESSQFQAGKLEKKLEDFRDRVRNDLQKIRSRERELASRLEIQKRDAEALLSAKDERLLNQKRDIDRLEFEIDKLRERLIDDVNRSEERRKRIARALQSLKLAQSVLSGLDEESIEKEEKSKAA
jgi:hypothetical protein